MVKFSFRSVTFTHDVIQCLFIINYEIHLFRNDKILKFLIRWLNLLIKFAMYEKLHNEEFSQLSPKIYIFIFVIVVVVVVLFFFIKSTIFWSNHFWNLIFFLGQKFKNSKTFFLFQTPEQEDVKFLYFNYVYSCQCWVLI